MKHLAPACFRAFRCAAGSCPDSCCRAGWEIVPDEETLALYRSLPGEAGARIRAGIVPACSVERGTGDAGPSTPLRCAQDDTPAGEEPLLRQDERRVCVLLDPDGLCHVQRNFGHEALCRVCREYPRFHREFGNLTEHGLSLSCPTAYALATAQVPAWEEWEDDAPIVPNELDPAAYLRLHRGRELALELLTREELPFWQRIALVRRLAAAMQAAPEKHIRHDYNVRLRRWESLPLRCREDSCPRSGTSLPYGALARRFLALEILSPAWRDALERFLALAETGQLPQDLLTPEDPEPCARWLWNELYKYWLDALDDGNLLGRVQRSLDMLLLGMAMDRALPGEGPFLRRISREIEHCEENLAALLK